MLDARSYRLLTAGFATVFLPGIAVGSAGGAELTPAAAVAGVFFGLVLVLLAYYGVSPGPTVAYVVVLLSPFFVFTGEERIFFVTVLAATGLLTTQVCFFRNWLEMTDCQ